MSVVGLDAPSFVKTDDPDNLGVSCGFSTKPPLLAVRESFICATTTKSTKLLGNI